MTKKTCTNYNIWKKKTNYKPADAKYANIYVHKFAGPESKVTTRVSFHGYLYDNGKCL